MLANTTAFGEADVLAVMRLLQVYVPQNIRKI